jgi:CheY-like chemotaxis protein
MKLSPVGRRILLVDDYAPAANAVADLLRLCGHTVTIASTSRDAVAFAVAAQAEIVFLDLCLAEANDGVSVARQLREQPSLQNVTLIAYSGLDMHADIEYLRDAGFDEQLRKPVDLQTLEEVIARAGTDSSEPATVGADGTKAQ